MIVTIKRQPIKRNIQESISEMNTEPIANTRLRHSITTGSRSGLPAVRTVRTVCAVCAVCAVCTVCTVGAIVMSIQVALLVPEEVAFKLEHEIFGF